MDETPLGSLTLDDFEDWRTQLSEYAGPWYDHVIVPRPVGKIRIILHAFSGRRRPGDVQDFLDAAMLRRTNYYMVFTVFLDLMVGRTWGNISIPATRSYWISAARDGLLHHRAIHGVGLVVAVLFDARVGSSSC